MSGSVNNTELKTHFAELKKLIDLKAEFPLTGSDIMNSLGIKEGAEVGEKLNLAKKFWFQSKFKADKKELLEHLKTLSR